MYKVLSILKSSSIPKINFPIRSRTINTNAGIKNPKIPYPFQNNMRIDLAKLLTHFIRNLSSSIISKHSLISPHTPRPGSYADSKYIYHFVSIQTMCGLCVSSWIQEHYFHYRADESTEIPGKGRKIKPAEKSLRWIGSS